MADSSYNVAVYKTKDKITNIDVLYDEKSVWLNMPKICALYRCDKSTVYRHRKNIFINKILDEKSVIKDFLLARIEGEREVSRKIKHYNLDFIVEIGKRYNPDGAKHFEKWAKKLLKYDINMKY